MNPRRALHSIFAAVVLPIAASAEPPPVTSAPATTAAQTMFVPRTQTPAVHGDNLVLRSVLGVAGNPYPGTTFTVSREEPDAFGKMRYTVLATSGPQAVASFRLAPGTYRIDARNGAVETTQMIEVPGDRALHHDVALNAGELHLSSRLTQGGAAAHETWFRVFREDTDAYGKPIRTQVAGNGYADATSFVLPAGDYLAEATYGNAQLVVPVTVHSGASTEQLMVLNAGIVELNTLLATDLLPADEVTYRVYYRDPARPAADWQEMLDTQARGAFAMILPAGIYRVRAELDRAAQEVAFQLAAGETLHHELNLNAAVVNLFAELTGHSEPLLNTTFRISPIPSYPAPDAAASSQAATHKARFIVPAGDYLASAINGESIGRVQLEIVAGDEATFAIPLDAGRVTLAMATPKHGKPSPFNWFSVYRVERDARGNTQRRRIFNDGYFAETDLILPAGDYVAQVRNDFQRGERDFRVAPGDVTTVSIPATP